MALTQLPGTMLSTVNTLTSASGQPLVLQTNNGTTALTINTSQQATFTNNVSMPNTFGFKNRIINGAMVIDQRYSGASQSPAPSGYSADRWAIFKAGTGTWSYQLSSNAPAGFSSSMLLTVTATETPSSGDYFIIQQPIEGFNTYDLSWGTANAKTITLSAWVYSSVTGTFSGALRNFATTLSYAFSYSIPTANTWTQISVTIPGPTTATWVGATNGVGIYLNFCLSAGSTNLTAAGSWTSGNYIGATGQTSWISTSSATFYLTGVQLEVGTAATSFDYRPYGTELALCQRYFEMSYDIGTAPGTATSSGLLTNGGFFNGASANYGVRVGTQYKVTKRAAPTVTTYDSSGASGKCNFPDTSTGVTMTVIANGMSGFTSETATVTTTQTRVYWQYTSSAEL
jgi:hypothetical protein